MSINALAKPVFQPAMRIITAITNANPALVTTSFANNFITGTIVRIDIPPKFGMQQINQQFGPITVVSPTTFTIPIDTTLYDAFFVAADYPYNEQLAQAVSFAEINDILTAAVQNVLPY